MRAALASVLLACLMPAFFKPPATEAQKFEADLVILDRDIFRIDPAEIEKVKVRMTVMDGRVVYEQKD
ncbi:MAG: amidohydrolase family protein [Pyrinomonadaceae bacterium]